MTRDILALAGTAILFVAALANHPVDAAPQTFERDSAGGAVDGQTVRQPARPRREVLAIIPDRTTGRDWGLRYLSEAVDDLNRTMPDAVFCVGDLVQGYSRSDAQVERERTDFLSLVRRLQVPFYPAAGNHDLVGGTRDANDRSLVAAHRARVGPLYYAVELELVSVVILNTEDGEGRIEPGLSQTQLGWLDTTLARLAARNRPIVLILHRPLWDHAPTRWNERVQPLLVEHGVDYVIAGHYHSMQQLPARDGIPYLLVGTCGGAIDQHPLAGHLHHLTYVTIDDTGSITPYHQVVGTTLPVDWIERDDQVDAFALKRARDAVVIRGAVPDPLGAPSEGSIEVVLRNPLDRPTRWRLHPTEAPTSSPVIDRDADGVAIERVWTSRTEIDIFNPFTTDLASPFELSLPAETIALGPGESRTVEVKVRADAQVRPPQPAPFEIVAEFEDSKGRTVPVRLRQRVPIARTLTLGASLSAAIEYPIAVWRWSEYDTAEANARARFARGSGDSVLDIALTVPDRTLSADPNAGLPPSSADRQLNDPLGDAVRVILGEGAGAREFLVTFVGDQAEPEIRTVDQGGERLTPTDAAWAVFTRGDASWTLQLSLRREALPEGSRLGDLRINVGVADNDETYHTQWRWLAPRNIPAKLLIGG
jgi:3',5'-cyclic AMP phosphodiesterase CpdA